MSDAIKINSFWKKSARVDKNIYNSMYQESIQKNNEFWKKHGRRIDWIKPFTKIKDCK